MDCDLAQVIAKRTFGATERKDSFSNLYQAGGQVEAHYRRLCPCYGYPPVERISIPEVSSPPVTIEEPESTFRHGLHAYRVRKCRCDLCVNANEESRRRYRPLSDSVKIRLDSGPFIRRLTRDGRLDAVENSTIASWRKSGIGIYSADKWCIRLGYHPIEIWGQDFYVSIEPEPEDQLVGG